MESVFQSVVTEDSGRRRVVNLTPTSQELALKLLDLAFDFGLKVYVIQHDMAKNGKVFQLLKLLSYDHLLRPGQTRMRVDES